jgi:hypothetical protein
MRMIAAHADHRFSRVAPIPKLAIALIQAESLLSLDNAVDGHER